jgi:hypothetical protein
MEHLEQGRSRYSRKRVRGELTSGVWKEGKCPYQGKLARMGEEALQAFDDTSEKAQSMVVS